MSVKSRSKAGEVAAKKPTTATPTATKMLAMAATSTKAQLPPNALVEDQLPPLFLTFVVLLCSGFVLIFSLRDFMMTGRNIFGAIDESYLLFTKSTDWFEDAKGWKSTQGGFSAVADRTTDENNMGGFFVRKMAGAASAGVCLQKMIPFLFHLDPSIHWAYGHFRPLLLTSVLANLSIGVFFALSWDDLTSGGAAELPKLWLSALAVETLVFLYYIWYLTRNAKRGPAVAMKDGKNPSSPPSRIVSRTIATVSSAVAVIAARDLFMPGFIMELVPRDDIYLEWTNALRHSPPDGTPESTEHGLESPLFVGDKYVSQFMALHVLILCGYKFASACIRIGADGRGEAQTKLFWKMQAVSNGMMLFLFRLFAPPARTASLDLRWHLCAIGYESFMLFLYGYF